MDKGLFIILGPYENMEDLHYDEDLIMTNGKVQRLEKCQGTLYGATLEMDEWVRVE